MAEEFSNAPYEPGTYVKGDQTRVADTTADAVQAVFDGFSRQTSEADVAFGTAAVNDNDPESVRSDEPEADEDELDEEPEDDEDDEDPTPGFDDESPSDTSATPNS